MNFDIRSVIYKDAPVFSFEDTCKAFELSADQMKQIVKEIHDQDVNLWLDYQGEKTLFLTEPQFYCAIFESHSDLAKKMRNSLFNKKEFHDAVFSKALEVLFNSNGNK